MSEADEQETALEHRILTRVLTAMGGRRRDGQVRMIDEGAAALKSGHHVMIQAGTGTGKSIGYLIPVLARAAESGARTLITTATLALQRQILTKDAPLVIDAVADETGVRPHVALLKGWSNYVCKYRADGGRSQLDTLFDAADAHQGPISDLGKEVTRVREWARTTDTGDRDDLIPGVSDRAWRQVSVSKRECMGRDCPFVEECFAGLARDEALEADVVVSNHSLFGIDTMSALNLFGELDHVVVDECHELASRVRSQACCEISKALCTRVARVVRTLVKSVDIQPFEQAASALMDALDAQPDGLMVCRPDAVVEAISVCDSTVRTVASEVEQSSVEQSQKLMAQAACDEFIEAIDAWNIDPAQTITYIERDTDSSAVSLKIAPLDVAGPLGAVGLGERAAILTSATLALGGSFDSAARECGLMVSHVPWHGIDVGSPFDVARQGVIYVAQHLPVPGREGPSGEALDELVTLTQAAGGGVLALFSAWRGLKAGARALREGTSLDVYVQGEETTSALVSRFRNERDSCLVGTLSLWQGVDVVGPSCRLVVIDRIPFPHPDNAVFQALQNDAAKRGVSGFGAVALPHAALLMAQGAGRLLRSSQDQGVVAVLDPRLVTKSYGSFIRATMPQMWPTTDSRIVVQALERLAASLDTPDSSSRPRE